jgi:hypothetical protein
MQGTSTRLASDSSRSKDTFTEQRYGPQIFTNFIGFSQICYFFFANGQWPKSNRHNGEAAKQYLGALCVAPSVRQVF